MSDALVYVDTSLLVKRYLQEPDSGEAAAFLRKITIATSAITELELAATVHAAHRARGISKAQLRAVLRQIERDQAAWFRLDVTPAVIARARQVVSMHPLRSVDAIHCASALIVQESQPAGFAFATSDRRQRIAAASLGLACAGRAREDAG